MKKWLLGLLAVGVLGMGWWLVSPLFMDEMGHDESVMSDHGDMDGEDAMMEDSMEESSDGMKEDDGKMDDSMKEHDMMEGADSSSSDDMTKDTMEAEALNGTFKGADADHEAKGKVMVSAQNVQLEDFEVTDGPDLYVYLVKEGQDTKDGVSLGKLKQNMGSQSYEIPEGASAAAGMEIVIWCKKFNEDFGRAKLGSEM
ncbi:DM13 domain-containing protein [Bacillus sp. KH172YL63]|uniref:DM13 domain-containing protein n=1 Tax=Bacillus sp. KH172YL63 TaxID=2709784 RepID=UPI0013E41FD2|nr:DM13 domain-containing protein [Bacillus sp. KH172YL63]BCB05554.1 hypothetical protein KH172YL63_36870 [Bacillus sp. KH172YL63]